MKKKLVLSFSLIVFALPFSSIAQYQFEVSGTIIDSSISEPLPGVSISLSTGSAGSVSDKNGHFHFTFSANDEQVTLLIKYVGKKTREIIVHPGNNTLIIYLQKDILDQPEVVITESRIPKSILESPVTIVKIDEKAISQMPNENFYAGLASQKGVDLTSASLFYQTINLRGFGYDLNEGVLQLVDGMDNTPPGQGFSVGNLGGVNDIDVESVEIIPGSSSAIYGANAFNGLVNITTKNPFRYPGLSVQLKNGFNNLDGKYHDPALFFDYSFRYAKAYNNRFAFKVNFTWLDGTDWLKLSEDDLDINATAETRGKKNPGRDIANLYGDEFQLQLPLGIDSSIVNVSRTGYNANELLGEHTKNYRGNISLHYKFNSKTELSYLYSYSTFNSNVGVEGWNFTNFSMTYHKVELKNDNYFVRAYMLMDHDGNSYDAYTLAYNMTDKWKSDSQWGTEFTNAYNGNIAGLVPQDFETAREYADIGRPLPGSETYNHYFNEITSELNNGGSGARFADESGIVKLLGQYDFSKLFSPVQIICGVDIGSRKLVSHGTMFLDYPGTGPIYDRNYSGYVQAKKENIGKSLDLLGSVRIDKFDNFKTDVTPRLAAVYKLKQKHFIRASFQTGSRNPDPFDQYREWNYFNYHGIGGLSEQGEKYQIQQRSFDFQSVLDYTNSVSTYLNEYGQDSLNAAIQLYKGILQPSGIQYIQPENLKTIEVGYQALLARNKIHFDIDFFLNFYNHLISYTWTTTPGAGNPFHPDSIEAAAQSFLNYDASYFNLPVNINEEVKAWGMETGMEFNFYKEFFLSGNLTIQKSDIDPKMNAYLSTIPPFRTNASLSNPNVYKQIGFSINWRWTDYIATYYNQRDPSAVNSLPAKNVVDAQVSYALPKLNTIFKLGASNLLGHYYRDVPNGSSVGGVYYVSFLYTTR